MRWKDGTPVKSSRLYVEYADSYPYRQPDARPGYWTITSDTGWVKVYGEGSIDVYAIATDKDGKEWTSGAGEIQLSDAGDHFTLQLTFDEPAPKEGSPASVPVKGSIR
jgi:hypothetical protein